MPTTEFFDRLSALQSSLTGENRHTEAMLIDAAIQALKTDDLYRRLVETIDRKIAVNNERQKRELGRDWHHYDLTRG